MKSQLVKLAVWRFSVVIAVDSRRGIDDPIVDLSVVPLASRSSSVGFQGCLWESPGWVADDIVAASMDAARRLAGPDTVGDSAMFRSTAEFRTAAEYRSTAGHRSSVGHR